MAQTLVLINSSIASVHDAQQLILPYLDHIGIAYELVDVFHQPLPADLDQHPLIIVAQRLLDPHGRRLGSDGVRLLREAVEQGTGLVSFDPTLELAQPGMLETTQERTPADTVTVVDNGHCITAGHEAGETFILVGPLAMPGLPPNGDTVLLRFGDRPLLAVGSLGKGRVVRWATARWAHTRVLGPMAGLDDIFWRSLVWAARKPFVIRSLAPLVAMRVDDVAASGERWGQSPLFWAEIAAQHGFRPWLGLFLYNLTGPAIAEVRSLVERGRATAFPHAFGRPPRAGDSKWFYTPDALPLRSASYDEFIYFDHEHGQPWSDAEAAHGLHAVDAWYATHGPLPISTYAVAHWYEMGSNVVPHMVDRWGVEFLGKIQDIDAPLRNETPWLRLGPFRRYELPGSCLFDPALRGDRPVYYADFMTIGGRRLFNCVTEIRDDAGYEWAPDPDVAGTVGRGVRQLRRALDSMAPAVLFTHETDFIYRIPPEQWETALAQIAHAIRPYNPLFVTLDQAVRIVRATHTTRLAAWQANSAIDRIVITITGHSDVPTHCRVYTESDQALAGTLVTIPPVDGESTIHVTLS